MGTVEQIQILFDFCDRALYEYRQISVSTGPDADFAEVAWPSYLASITNTDRMHQFYLSVDELLLLCDLAKLNVVVFKHMGSELRFEAGIFHHVGDLILVKLASNQLRRVRSHFERIL